MLALGSCHPACKREAMYLRSLEVEIVISIVVLMMLSSIMLCLIIFKGEGVLSYMLIETHRAL